MFEESGHQDLCEEILGFVKKISLIDIRKLIRDINPDLFPQYLLFLSELDRNGYKAIN